MLVANVSEPSISVRGNVSGFRRDDQNDSPVNLTLVFEQSQGNTMHGSIAPTFIEEATGTVQVVKELAVFFAPPEVQIANFEVGPEMARRVPICLLVILRPPLMILQPLACIIWMHIVGMISDEFLSLRPERRHAFWTVIDVDVEPVRFVVVLHPAEHIIVDVAEEVHVGLHAPVVLEVLEGRMFREEPTVPSAHFVVRDLGHVLDFLFFEEGNGLLKKVHVDPGGYVPVFFGHFDWGLLAPRMDSLSWGWKCAHTVPYFCFGSRSSFLLELFGEINIIEECPRIIKLVVPRPLKVRHRLQHITQLLIAHQCHQSRGDSVGIRIIGRVIVALYTM
jgi:hypothetical protein